MDVDLSSTSVESEPQLTSTSPLVRTPVTTARRAAWADMDVSIDAEFEARIAEENRRERAKVEAAQAQIERLKIERNELRARVNRQRFNATAQDSSSKQLPRRVSFSPNLLTRASPERQADTRFLPINGPSTSQSTEGNDWDSDTEGAAC